MRVVGSFPKNICPPDIFSKGNRFGYQMVSGGRASIWRVGIVSARSLKGPVTMSIHSCLKVHPKLSSGLTLFLTLRCEPQIVL